jgi:hypothetical protein
VEVAEKSPLNGYRIVYRSRSQRNELNDGQEYKIDKQEDLDKSLCTKPIQ